MALGECVQTGEGREGWTGGWIEVNYSEMPASHAVVF